MEIAQLVYLAVLEIQDFQAVQLCLEAQDFQVALAFLEALILIQVQKALAQSLYRLQLVRSCHPDLFYHQALFNNQVHKILLE